MIFAHEGGGGGKDDDKSEEEDENDKLWSEVPGLEQCLACGGEFDDGGCRLLVCGRTATQTMGGMKGAPGLAGRDPPRDVEAARACPDCGDALGDGDRCESCKTWPTPRRGRTATHAMGGMKGAPGLAGRDPPRDVGSAQPWADTAETARRLRMRGRH